MASKTYREPGVYLAVQNTVRGTYQTDVRMLPLIIGTGATQLKKTIQMIRSETGVSDTFPFTTTMTVQAVKETSKGQPAWTEYNAESSTGDYTIASTEVDNVTTTTITWQAGSGPNAGDAYYVDLTYTVDASQYEPQFFETINDVVAFYGPDVQEAVVNTPVCPISLGAQIALEQGATGIYTIQVSEATASAYSAALDDYARYIPEVWRIIPLDTADAITKVCEQHINRYSTVEERLERTGFFGKGYAQEADIPTTFATVLTTVGGFADGIKSRRECTFYPDFAMRDLSDGVRTKVGHGFIACAIAGAEMAQPLQRSRTRMSISSFHSIQGVKMTRSEMNKLAAKGVAILTQENAGAAILVRHGITTDMNDVQSREMSIVNIQDYCSKSIRNALDIYIGKYNITNETIEQIKGTLTTVFSGMQNDGVIVNGVINQIVQDQDNPDTLIISVSVLPPYPCNYIDITMVLE